MRNGEGKMLSRSTGSFKSCGWLMRGAWAGEEGEEQEQEQEEQEEQEEEDEEEQEEEEEIHDDLDPNLQSPFCYKNEIHTVSYYVFREYWFVRFISLHPYRYRDS